MSRLESVTTKAEGIGDRPLRPEEPLSVADRFEPAHLPFALPSGLMRNLRSIVQTLSLFVDDTRQDLIASCTIAPQLIGHDSARHIS